jgi:predicted permease
MKALLRRRQLDRDLDDELQFHLAMGEQKLTESGVPAEEARYGARREFGNATQAKEASRELWTFPSLETLWQDIRFGLRQLRRNPGFTAVAVITLALGIGANTAIFSVVDGVLIHPLPFKDSDRLVVIWQRVPHVGPDELSTPDFVAWKQQTFMPIAATTQESFNIGEGDRTEHVPARAISANFFSLLAVKPIIGRTFLREEDRPNSRKVVILSYGLWQRDFSGDRGVLGKVLELSGQPFTVIGVMPRNFTSGLELGEQLWVPLDSDPTFTATRHSNSVHWLGVIGRLRKGATLSGARAAMTVLAGSLGKEYPQTDVRLGVDVDPLADYVVGSVRPALLILFVAVGLVLLIACANVANLLLARATTRAREIAVRIAVGAGRARVVRQLLTESVLLACLGGGFGLVFAFWSLGVLRRLNPGDIPHLKNISIDPAVLVFAIVLCVLTGILFGAAPAYQASKADLYESLKESGRGSLSSPGRKELRDLLVVFEVVLSVLLLIGAGLMVRSFRALEATPLGFNPHRLLVMRLSSSQAESAPAATPTFYERVLARVRSLPGVELAAIARDLPLVGANPSSPFSIAGRPVASPQHGPAGRCRWISADYFRTMGVPILKGRTLTDEDNSTAAGAVVINQEMVRHFWPHRNPIGEEIKPTQGASGWCTIVGIAGNVRKGGPEFPVYPTMYYSYLQVPAPDIPLIEGSMRLVIRSSLPASVLTGSVRRAVSEIDRGTPVYDVRTMDEIVSSSMARARFDSALFGMFGLLALLMAVAGIYAVISYSVTRRTHEIGIRMALGAQKGDVLRLVVGQGMILTLVGVGVGIIGAAGLTRFLSSLLYGVKPTDPLTFIAASLILTGTALLACYMPARRAAKVDPMVALRHE